MKLVISYYYYGIEDDTHEMVLTFEYESKEAAVKLFADTIKQIGRHGRFKFCNYTFDAFDLVEHGYEILTLDEWFEQNKLNK